MATITIPDSTYQRLQMMAAARKMPLEQYLSEIVGNSGMENSAKQLAALESFTRGMTQWTSQHLPAGHVVDDSREKIYEARRVKILLDTNILLRLSERSHAHHPAAVESVRRLAGAGNLFCIGSQTIFEFLAVATRSIVDPGLGMTQAAADAELSKLIAALDIYCDSPAVIDELRRLVIAHGVTGKSVHDTRLVATMIVNGLRDILTFNVQDFVRFGGINVIDPTKVSTSA